MPLPWVRYLSPAELPERPDPTTGLPRPPHAPGYTGPDFASDPDLDGQLAQATSAPPGQGPVLAWYRPSRRSALLIGGGAALAIMVVFIVGVGWNGLTFWLFWVGAALGGVGIYFCIRAGDCRAGTDWLASGKYWVQTYELTRIRSHANNGDPELEFFDRDDRRLVVSISNLRSNRLLWDLVYNGILHSVIAGGARTDGQLHLLLKLPYPAATKPPE